MSHPYDSTQQTKLRFVPEVTLGNVLQLFAIVGGLGGFMIANEHRMTAMEVKQQTFQSQVERLTEATDKLVEVVNRFVYTAPDFSDSRNLRTNPSKSKAVN